MNIAGDDRARVPFAVIGVLLLLGSATYAATVRERGPAGPRPNLVAAGDRLDGAVDTAVRRATAEAATRAAARPVTDPAATQVGRILGERDTFRRYLRLRIYRAVARGLATVEVRVGAVRATASLAPIRNVTDAARAVEAVSVRRGDVPGSIRVHVDGIVRRYTRNGRVVRREEGDLARTVATPVLALHDRVERSQRRVNRSALTGPGMGRRLAGSLHALAWSRGYLQYGGVPVANVVGNRHVAVLANEALLAQQRAVFGRADPAGLRALGIAGADTLVGDLEAATGSDTIGGLEDVLATGRTGSTAGTAFPVPFADLPASPKPGDTIRLGMDAVADEAFAAFVTGVGGGPSLSGVLADAYRVRVRIRADVRHVQDGSRPPAVPPGENWTLESTSVRRSVTVSSGDAVVPDSPGRWHPLATYERWVIVRRTVHRTWRAAGDNGRRRTTATWTDTYRVGIVMEGRHAGSGPAPMRPVRPVHEPGGPLDGPNLEGIAGRARRRLVDDRSGVDALARRAVRGELDQTPVAVRGAMPPGLEAWVYPSLVRLREAVRRLDVAVPRGAVWTGRTSPAALLAARLAEHRSDLVDAPASYDGVASKAKIAAQLAYLEAVRERLRRLASAAEARQEAVDALLDRAGTGVEAATTALGIEHRGPPGRRPMLADGLAGPVVVDVAGSPAYLTRSPVDNSQVAAVGVGVTFHPLAVRNWNVFAVPTGDATDAVVDAVVGGTDDVDLRVAALALRSANRTAAVAPTDALRGPRRRLAESVADSLGAVAERLAGVVAERTGLPAAESRRIVTAAVVRWGRLPARALAVTNGSVPRSVATSVAGGRDLAATERDRLLLALRATLREARTNGSARVGGSTVRDVVMIDRQVTRRLVGDLVDAGIDRASDLARERVGPLVIDGVSAGLPVAPVPGHWYATANVWVVTVRGAYASFAVTARNGRPADPAGVGYVRDGGVVALDVDGDGSDERLGRAARVTFDVTVPVVVVVPPGPPGVGDVDGNADERSAGWPSAGPARPANGSVDVLGS